MFVRIPPPGYESITSLTPSSAMNIFIFLNLCHVSKRKCLLLSGISLNTCDNGHIALFYQMLIFALILVCYGAL